MNEEENKTDKGLTLAEFQPAEAQLQELANRARNVDVSNIREVHTVRIELRDARTSLTKKGKELREGALLFQKKVIAKEKDLLAIILADEERLEAIENEAKQREEMEKRRVALPARIAALQSIGDNSPIDENELLKMDDNLFNEYRLSRIERKLQADKLAAEAEQREKDRIAREKLEVEKAEFEKAKKADEDKRRAEQAEIDKEKARLAGIEEQRQKEEKARQAEAERIANEEKARIQREKDEADRKIAAQKKQEADKDYQDWLIKIGYDEKKGDTIGRDHQGAIVCWRPIGTYYPKN